MTYIPFNDKAGYDMQLFPDSTEGSKAAKERLAELNKQGPKGWRLLPLEG